MTNPTKTLLFVVVGLLVTISTPRLACAQDTNAPAKTSKTKKKSAVPKPDTFSAKVAAVDKVAMTITLDNHAKQVLQITSDTLITKDGKPAIFADGAVGDQASGTYQKAENGKLGALLLNFGEKPKAKKAEKKVKKPATATNAPLPEPVAPVNPAPAAAPAPSNAPALPGQ